MNAQKRKSSQNQPTKQKQANKSNKGNNPSRRETSRRVKIVCFAFSQKTEIVLIASFTILLNWTVNNQGIDDCCKISDDAKFSLVFMYSHHKQLNLKVEHKTEISEEGGKMN